MPLLGKVINLRKLIIETKVAVPTFKMFSNLHHSEVLECGGWVLFTETWNHHYDSGKFSKEKEEMKLKTIKQTIEENIIKGRHHNPFTFLSTFINVVLYSFHVSQLSKREMIEVIRSGRFVNCLVFLPSYLNTSYNLGLEEFYIDNRNKIKEDNIKLDIKIGLHKLLNEYISHHLSTNSLINCYSIYKDFLDSHNNIKNISVLKLEANEDKISFIYNKNGVCDEGNKV